MRSGVTARSWTRSCVLTELDLLASLLHGKRLPLSSGFAGRGRNCSPVRNVILGLSSGARGHSWRRSPELTELDVLPGLSLSLLLLLPSSPGFPLKGGQLLPCLDYSSGDELRGYGPELRCVLLFSRAQAAHLTLTSASAPLELRLEWKDTQLLAHVDCGLEDVLRG